MFVGNLTVVTVKYDLQADGTNSFSGVISNLIGLRVIVAVVWMVTVKSSAKVCARFSSHSVKFERWLKW